MTTVQGASTFMSFGYGATYANLYIHTYIFYVQYKFATEVPGSIFFLVSIAVCAYRTDL